MKCEICGNNHKTWEHGIYEKIKLAKLGVPIETLFVMPGEIPEVDKLMKEVNR